MLVLKVSGYVRLQATFKFNYTVYDEGNAVIAISLTEDVSLPSRVR